MATKTQPPTKGRHQQAEAPSNRSSDKALPPGSRMPSIVNMLRYALSRYAAMKEGLRYGDCYTVRMLGQPPIVNFTDPAAIKDIFAADADTVHSGEATAAMLGPIIGWNSLLVLDGPRWSRERRLMQPPFHGERMHNYAATISRITKEVIDTWSPGATFSIHSQMQKITLEVIMRVVFGVEDSQKLARLRKALLRTLGMMEGTSAPFLFFPVFRIDFGGFTPWARYRRYRSDVQAILLSEIHRRQTEGTAERKDVLSMLIDARDEEGRAMNDDELLDEMLTLLGAGHETTATSLAWAFYHILRRTDVTAKLSEELDLVVGGGPIQPGHLPELKYLAAVIDETARLTPVATAILRRVKRPIRIGGQDIPASVNVSVPIYAVHHRPDLWPHPERFDPDRFINTSPKPNTFFPFGGGVRRCLGAAFASYEMKIVLAEVLSRVQMHVTEGYRARGSCEQSRSDRPRVFLW